MISDACRSIPNTPRAMKVRGSIVFPNEDTQRARAQIDKFMAAAVGTAAYEVPRGDSGKKENVFTRCFLRAFAAPDLDMIREITEDGQVIRVVPNRKLGKYLQREVAALLTNVNVRLDQTPDAEVLSDDDIYIGRAQTPPQIKDTIHRLPDIPGHPDPFDASGLGHEAKGTEPPAGRRRCARHPQRRVFRTGNGFRPSYGF
jgi:hypothetical protein